MSPFRILLCVVSIGWASPVLAQDAQDVVACEPVFVPPEYQPLFELGRTWTLQLKESMRVLVDKGPEPNLKQTFHEVCEVTQVQRFAKVAAARVQCTLDGHPHRSDMSLAGVYVATPAGLAIVAAEASTDISGLDAEALLKLHEEGFDTSTVLAAPIPLVQHRDMKPRGGFKTWRRRLSTPNGSESGWCTLSLDNNDSHLRQWCFTAGWGPTSGRFTLIDLAAYGPWKGTLVFYTYTSTVLGGHHKATQGKP
ncbi:MAG: hypothetical protein AAFS10_28275 [Myxococcota bacterium]